MILILGPDTDQQGAEFRQLMAHLSGLHGIQARVHTERGAAQALTEIYLIGNTQQLEIEDMLSLPCVERVVRVSEERIRIMMVRSA